MLQSLRMTSQRRISRCKQTSSTLDYGIADPQPSRSLLWSGEAGRIGDDLGLGSFQVSEKKDPHEFECYTSYYTQTRLIKVEMESSTETKGIPQPVRTSHCCSVIFLPQFVTDADAEQRSEEEKHLPAYTPAYIPVHTEREEV